MGVLAAGWRAPRSLTSRLDLAVWPTDVDLNVHLTNSRYPVMMDLGRLDLLLRSGVLWSLREARVAPLVAEIHTRFLKDLPLGTRFTLETRAVGRDRKAIVMRQRFLVGQAEHAVADVNVLTVRSGRVVEPEVLLPLLEVD